MDLIRTIQARAEPHPRVYRVLLAVYGLAGEVLYLFHALVSGKLFNRVKPSPWRGAFSRQAVRYREIRADVESLNGFRQWLKRRDIRFHEGGWTIYIPPQESTGRCFQFLQQDYPPGAGLKILKDFKGPENARYTVHRRSPAPGAAILRSLTPSPAALVRTANYLYRCGVGIRVYDILGLRSGGGSLTCYVVEHAGGGVAEERDYLRFMENMREVLGKGVLTTGHARVDTMEDLMPPDCNGNLRLRLEDRTPVYVDFQGFLFRNEDRMIRRVFSEAGPHLRFDPAEAAAGRDELWGLYREMFLEAGCEIRDRPVMELGCGGSFAAYQALSSGASWVFGWYPPGARAHVERLLLVLGATRFDTFDLPGPGGDSPAVLGPPGGYAQGREGVVFLACAEKPGSEDAWSSGLLQRLSWEYIVCEDQQDVPGTMPLASRNWVDRSGIRRTARLLGRDGTGRHGKGGLKREVNQGQ